MQAVDWTQSGSCEWSIDDEGCLTIRPQDGVSGTLNNWGQLLHGSHMQAVFTPPTLKRVFLLLLLRICFKTVAT